MHLSRVSVRFSCKTVTPWHSSVKHWAPSHVAYQHMKKNSWQSCLLYNSGVLTCNFKFVILTDQKSLTQLTDQRLHTHWQQKVFSKLLGLQYRIVYRSGSDNRAADALSRHPSPPAVCAAVTSLVPSWISAVLASYRHDSFATTMLTKLSVDSAAIPHYSLQSGLLCYNGRVWIGDDPAFHHQLIAQFHSSSWGRHSRIPVTYMRLKQCFA